MPSLRLHAGHKYIQPDAMRGRQSTKKGCYIFPRSTWHWCQNNTRSNSMSDKKYQSIKKYAKLTLKKNGKKKERKNEQKKNSFSRLPWGRGAGEKGERGTHSRKCPPSSGPFLIVAQTLIVGQEKKGEGRRTNPT